MVFVFSVYDNSIAHSPGYVKLLSHPRWADRQTTPFGVFEVCC